MTHRNNGFMNTDVITNPSPSRMRVTRVLLAATAALALTLVGCTPQAELLSATETTAGAMADQVTVTDAYIKEPSMPEMTGMFGDITNTGSSEVVIVGGSSDIAGMVEIHEVTAEGQMQAINGGLVIGAGKTSALRPGENHIMLMKLNTALAVGDEVTVTLKFSDGSTLQVTAPVKTVAGGDESYNESDEMSGSEDMSHSGM